MSGEGRPQATAWLKPPWQPGQSGYVAGGAKGFKRVLKLARGQSVEAMQTLIDCMRNPDAPWPIRVTASIAILERAWGKPKEHVQLDGDGIATLRIQFVDESNNGAVVDGEAFQLDFKRLKESESEP